MVLKPVVNASPRSAGYTRAALLIVLALLIGAFFAFDLGRYLSLDYLQQVRDQVAALVDARPIVAGLTYFCVYVVVTALSVPGAAVMTLAGGAVFGMGWGLLLASFASSAGATLAMLVARTLAGGWVQQRFAAQLEVVNRGLERDAAFFLFGLRMVPLFPFFVINLVMGLTRVSTWTFYWVSQVGMLAGTAVYVFAGTQLAEVESLGDILSPGLIIALSLLGLLPLLARWLLAWIRRGREQVLKQGEGG